MRTRRFPSTVQYSLAAGQSPVINARCGAKTQVEHAKFVGGDHIPVSSTLSEAAAPPATTTRLALSARLADLDRAKGLAILLVVFGHLVARQPPAGVDWYGPLRIAVYLFHMPFFMYLSGYVAFRSGAARMPPASWRRLAGQRTRRLLLPFLLFGLVILAGKLIAADFVEVDNVPRSFGAGLRALVWDTGHSPATSVWYMAVLFAFSLATPALLALDPSRVLLVAVAALAFIAPLPPTLYLDRAGTYFIFFVAGGLAADAGARWYRMQNWLEWPCMAGLLALAYLVASGRIAFTWTEGAQGFPYKWALLAAGLLSLPAIHGLVRHLPLCRWAGLAWLGRHVFVIYLLNTPFIGLTKAGLLQFTPWDGRRFLPFAAVLMAVGVFGPIAAKRLLLRRVPRLDRLTD
jgi:fucose 4-O-acetylase-like acetyltransferase